MDILNRGSASVGMQRDDLVYSLNHYEFAVILHQCQRHHLLLGRLYFHNLEDDNYCVITET